MRFDRRLTLLKKKNDAMKISQLVIVAVAAGILSSCLSSKSGTTVTNYSENISVLRPKFEAALPTKDADTSVNQIVTDSEGKDPTIDVTSKLDEMLATNVKKNQDIKYITGYTVQVYSGSSRENADLIKSEIYKQVPDARPKVAWVAPNFKVRVGTFLEKIEAEKLYADLRAHFPQAILIPSRIPNQPLVKKNK